MKMLRFLILSVLMLTSLPAMAAEEVSKSLPEILQFAMSGEGRLIAGAVLFLVIWVLKKHVPFVDKWLSKDGPAWLSSKRKKLAANALMAMGPAALMMTDPSANLMQVGQTALEIGLMSMGLHGGVKAFRHRAEAPEAEEEAPASVEVAFDEKEEEVTTEEPSPSSEKEEPAES